jgi:hypothetical protein
MKKQKPRFPGQVGDTKVQVIEEKFSNFGTYVWYKANGKPFTDGSGSVLSIEGMKDDKARIKQLSEAAAHYGEAEGRAMFFPNTRKISDEQYSEQMDRLKQGYIPSENDLGALIAAKKTIDEYGSED